jgi:hypothetical protein
VATPASQNVTLQVWILFRTPARSYFFRFIFLIDCRVLYTRAMLLRPVVLAAAKHRKNPAWMAQGLTNAKLEDHIALRVCLMCVDIIHALVTNIHDNLYIVYILSTGSQHGIFIVSGLELYSVTPCVIQWRPLTSIRYLFLCPDSCSRRIVRFSGRAVQ